MCSWYGTLLCLTQDLTLRIAFDLVSKICGLLECHGGLSMLPSIQNSTTWAARKLGAVSLRRPDELGTMSMMVQSRDSSALIVLKYLNASGQLVVLRKVFRATCELIESMWKCVAYKYFRKGGLIGSGYGELKFSHFCRKCRSTINHEILQFSKFRRDTEGLLLHGWPLGGTVLDGWTGLPNAFTTTEEHIFSATFPNRLVIVELKTEILQKCKPSTGISPTMNDIRDMVQRAITDTQVIKKVNHKSLLSRGMATRAERFAVRKMISRYWGNHSIFAIDLAGAVIRQGEFVDKMHQINWIHSPALENTMSRLLTKYGRFIEIMVANLSKVVVPTLDVDLAWHTHQLSPKQYYDFTVKETMKFIDHDDKIEEDLLSDGFEWTSKTYEKMFGEIYSECTCWYCEGLYIPFSIF